MSRPRLFQLRPARDPAPLMRARRSLTHSAQPAGPPPSWPGGLGIGAGDAAKLPQLPDGGLAFMARPKVRPEAGGSGAGRPGPGGAGGGVGAGGGAGGGAGCPSAPQMAEDYCSRTTLHGLKYVGDQELHPCERLFWLLVFTLAVVAATYYIFFLYEKWKENPVIVSLSPYATRINDIPFPAVTVCNMNRAKMSAATPILRGGDGGDSAASDYRLLKNLCDFEENVTKEENETTKWNIVQAFLVKVGPSCQEMVTKCQFGGKDMSCTDLFNPALTDEGICCSFNKVQRQFLFRNPRDLSDLNVTFPAPQVDWTPEGGYPAMASVDAMPFRPRGTGAHLGLSLVLDAQVDEYYCSSTTSSGFKIVLHSPVETPKIANMAQLIPAGQEVRLGLRPRISNATPQLHAIPLAKRQCYFSGEKPLRFYRTYTQRNCALECEANYTFASCKCVLYYMPKDANTSICGTHGEICASDARKRMEDSLADESEEDTPDVISKPQCHCLPGCSEINYRSFLSSSSLAPEHASSKDYVGNYSYTYFKKNMAIVHLFFTESQFTSHLKGELFGFTEFLSSTGGLLGLFMGFSFMSLVEIVYYVTLRLWCTIAKSRTHLHKSLNVDIDVNQTYTVYPFTQ